MSRYLVSIASVICLWAWGSSLPAQPNLRPIAPKFAPDPQVYTGKAVAIQQELTARPASNCSIPTGSPNHTLTIEKPMSALSVRVFAPIPVVITVRGKEGVTCRTGNNPEIMGAWPEGQYQIWINSLSDENVNYRLSLSETRQPNPPVGTK